MAFNMFQDNNSLIKETLGHIGLGGFDVTLEEHVTSAYDCTVYFSKTFETKSHLSSNKPMPIQLGEAIIDSIKRSPLYKNDIAAKDKEIAELKKELEQIKEKALQKAIG